MKKLRGTSLVALGITMTLLATACGGDTGPVAAGGDDSPDADETSGDEGSEDESAEEIGEDGLPSGEPELSEVVVGNMQIYATYLVGVAEGEGYFADEGISVTNQFAGGGAELLPALQAGSMDIVYSNVISVIQAFSQGADFELILDNGQIPDSSPDGYPLLVHTDSDISSWEDLEGASIAVNNLGSLSHLWLLDYMQTLGIDHESVEFLEAPLPTMMDGLLQSQYDAAQPIDPFRAMALRNDDIEVFDEFMSRANPGMNVAGWLATGAWLEANPNTAAAFVRAMERAREFVQDDEEAKLHYAQEWTDLDAGLLDEVIDAIRNGVLDLPTLQRSIDASAENGLIDDSYDVHEMVWRFALTSE